MGQVLHECGKSSQGSGGDRAGCRYCAPAEMGPLGDGQRAGPLGPVSALWT